MNHTHSTAFDALGLCLGPAGAGAARVLTEQRGATRLAICARGDGEGGAAAAEVAIRAICAARFIPALCRDRGFWTDLIESIDTYLYTAGRGGTCAVAVAAVIDGQVVGAGVGDIGVWLLSSSGTLELNRGRDPDAVAGSAVVEPDAFGPVPFEGALLLATDGAVRGAGLPRLRESALAQPTVSAALAEIATVDGLATEDVGLVLCRRA